jgi:hypothetical protein
MPLTEQYVSGVTLRLAATSKAESRLVVHGDTAESTVLHCVVCSTYRWIR